MDETTQSPETEATKPKRKSTYIGTPPGAKRTPAMKLADLAFIERLVLRAKPTREIAELLSAARPYKLSHVQVHKDIKKLEEMWLASAMKDISIEKQKMLRKLDVLESELWEAWDRSKQEEVQRTLTRTTADGTASPADEGSTAAAKKVEAARKVTRDGDASYTRQILEVMERRAKLLGLDAPTRAELSGPAGGPIVTQEKPISVEEEIEIARRHFARESEPVAPTENG